MCDEGESCFDFDDVYWNRFSDPREEMHNPKVVFHPYSLERLRNYRSIRTMALLRTNSSPVTELSDRALVTQYSLGLENGAPWEYIVALVNVLDTDIWLNIPHRATNGYVSAFADYVHLNLDSNLDVYLEYTNEHYNTHPDFNQSDYMLSEAQRLGIGEGENDRTRMNMFYALRSVELFDTWHGVFDPEQSRVKRVLGAFIADPGVSVTMLETPGVLEKTDMLAMGAYFGGYLGTPEVAEQIRGWTVDQLFDEMVHGGLTSDESANGALQEIYGYIDAHAAIADNYNVVLTAYEGGQHLDAIGSVEGDEEIEALLRAANQDPRMGDMYLEMLNYWISAGGNEFLHFNHIMSPLFGNFGSLEFQDSLREDSPKYDVLQDFIQTVPCWWADCDQ